MITDAKYKKINEQRNSFTYTSLAYTPYEYIADSTILLDTKDLILIQGRNEELSMTELYYCTNSIPLLLNAIDAIKEPVYMQFVPKDFVDEFHSHGFESFAYFRDMVCYDIHSNCSVNILSIEDAKEAAAVTRSCRLQSRGFLGETTEWAKNWIQGKDPNTSYCKYSAILATKHENIITGIVAVTLYSFDKPEGPTLWIREVAVRPEYQHKGYGKQLLSQAFAYGSRYQASKSFLMADILNTNAVSLYQQFGFSYNEEEGQIDMIRE
ncbi:GNAT family N-acetyltransferase [Anaerosporobacter sp.]